MTQSRPARPGGDPRPPPTDGVRSARRQGEKGVIGGTEGRGKTGGVRDAWKEVGLNQEIMIRGSVTIDYPKLVVGRKMTY